MKEHPHTTHTNITLPNRRSREHEDIVGFVCVYLYLFFILFIRSTTGQPLYSYQVTHSQRSDKLLVLGVVDEETSQGRLGGVRRAVASSSHAFVVARVKDGVEALGVVGARADQSCTLAWGCLYGRDEETPSFSADA